MDLDTLDEQIIAALRLDGRATFSELADVLGVSDQTVARRYRRLRTCVGLRVVGLPNAALLGYDMWLIRLRVAAEAAIALAEALARRPDTTWVTVCTGGTEIVCVVQNPGTADREALLMEKLPRTPRIVSVRAYCLMHIFAGGSVGAEPRPSCLTAAQIDRLQPPSVATGRPVLPDTDQPLIGALKRDGRMGCPELAAATGWSESSVRRRLEHLRETGAVFFDVEVDPESLGIGARVMLWLSVAPAHLATVGAALAEHPEVRFAAATTGETNLTATVIAPDMSALYRYLTERLGALPGVQRIDSAPALRHVKQVGTIQPA